ncbi:MAG TPA: TylF/MycF/NovP-related O-methyltransferase, partial [Candidatus Limnocylindrales bacterium]
DPARVTDVALAYDQNLTLPAAVLVESLLAAAAGPLRLWILSRGLDARYQAWLARAFPDLPITFLPCDDIAYGPDGRPRRVTSRITVSTMDRVFLPDLLEGVSRVVYLDVDTVALADVGALAAADLGDRPLAATDSNVTEDSEWQRAGRRMTEALALELRRRMARAHGFGHPALNAGVLVLDLDRMRRDDFSRRALGWIERYGLHDQDTMLSYVGPDRAVIEPRWNAMPRLLDIDDPAIIHWASFAKPWDPPLTFAKDRWQEHAARLHARAGDPPGSEREGSTGPVGSLSNPVAIGPVEQRQSDRVEAVIAAVRAEHLSYLDATSLRTLAAAVAESEAAAIDGLVIEAGVARGGSAITMAAAKSADRAMKLYDVFGMIPEPGERDGEDVHRRYATIRSGQAKGVGGETYYGYRTDLLDEVTASFARHGLEIGANHVELVQGRFEESITGDEPVALAHLDGDWYASTMACLTALAPRLSIGGRIILDDYDTWSGCRSAVHDYFDGRTNFRFERRARLHAVRIA